MRVLLILAILVYYSKYINSSLGVNYDTFVDTMTWQNLLSTMTESTNNENLFAVINAYLYNNTFNKHVIENINSAWISGIYDISLYMYPCIQSSIYSRQSNLICGRKYEVFS